MKHDKRNEDAESCFKFNNKVILHLHRRIHAGLESLKEPPSGDFTRRCAAFHVPPTRSAQISLDAVIPVPGLIDDVELVLSPIITMMGCLRYRWCVYLRNKKNRYNIAKSVVVRKVVCLRS